MMNNKVKQVLVLLFVVSTLLIMIGSVSANTDDLNENLEASNTLNDDLSVVEVDSGADKDVSNQLTISNIDEKTNGSSQIIGESNSENVVSNYEDTTIDAKDSDNNIIKASNHGDDVLSGPNVVITNTVLNPVVNVGDYVSFEIFVRNIGDAPSYGINVGDGDFIGVSLIFNSNQLKYDHFTPGINPDTMQTHADTYRNAIVNGPGQDGNQQIWFAYNCNGGFQPGWCFNFTATFKVLSHGILETSASIMWGGDPKKSSTISKDSELVITNTAIYPNINKDNEAIFEISIKNNGGTYQGLQDGGTYFLPVQLNYDTNQLEYSGVSYDNPNRYLDVRNNLWDNNVQFAYNTNGAFRNGESLKFTVSFKVKTTGTLKTNAGIVLYNAPSAEANVNVVNSPKFEITNVVSHPISNTGDRVSFEITVKNKGDTFYPTYIFGERFVGVNFWYDPNGLSYIDVTSSNPDMYLTPRVNPDNTNNLVQFAYKVGDAGFANGDSFKFNVNFNVKAHGTFETNAQITQFNEVSSRATTTSMNPSLSITNTALNPIVNIGDVVSFEVVGKNVGGTFTDNNGRLTLVMVTYYNLDELEYVSFSPNADNQLFELKAVEDGKVVVFYYPDNNNFENGDVFNYTVSFKVLKHGTIETTASSFQAFGPSSTAKIVSSDPNLTITETPSSKTLRVGDDLSFNYVVKNEGSKYNNNYISIEIDFDSDKMQYLGFTEIPNLSFESLQYTSSHLGNPLLGASIDNVLGADSSVGHLKLGYTSENGFDAGSSFNFDVLFKAVTDGKLQNTAQLSGDQLASSKVYGVAYAGDPSLKLTKTPDNEFKNVGDEVSYEIFLVNDGTLHFTDKDCIEINDYYHEGLVYDSCTVNSINAKGEKVKLTIRHNVYAPERHVNIIYNLTENGYDDWAPGSSLNITLHFHLVKTGIICNFVFSEWGTKDVASVAVEEPELNLTKTCLNTTVDLNDLVYYEIYVENTGNISYFDHSNAYGDQFLIIEDIYPDGLKFEGYTLNPDKNGNTWENNYASIEDVGDRVVIKYRTWEGWTPGSSLNITLKFRAVELGKLVNKAHVYWQWKDWGPKESQKEIELNEEADVVVGQPAFSIEKISNFKEAKVGDTVSFSIVYSNTGNRTITGAYIKDNKFSSGLQYLDFSDKDSWTFDGKDTWYYNGKLEAGQSATLTLFFKALTAGKHSNTALAGHNVNNDTLNDTDTVLIKEEVNGTADTEGSEVEPEEPDEEPDEEPSAPGVKGSVAAKSTIHPTGNPLVVLLISLLTLCFVQRKGKK